jgi:hypothetical protein
LGDLTFPNLTDDKPEQAPETTPTFDWATDSDEPDKAMQKIFDAVSSPELASQPPADADLTWMDKIPEDEKPETPTVEEQGTEDRWLDDRLGTKVETPPNQQPTSMEDFTVSAEPQLGAEAFAPEEQSSEPFSSDHLLWDNPNAKDDRLVILSRKSLVYASPMPSDIPHIMGLFAENKMLRDLLGDNAGAIKLESINRLSLNPKTSDITIDYIAEEKPVTHLFTFSSPQVRDEVLAALKLRLGSSFSETTHKFGLRDKIIPPVLALLIVIMLAWILIADVPMLTGVSVFQSGPLFSLLSSLQHFLSGIGLLYVILVAGILLVLSVIWLVSNLKKPSKLITLDRL